MRGRICSPGGRHVWTVYRCVHSSHSQIIFCVTLPSFCTISARWSVPERKNLSWPQQFGIAHSSMSNFSSQQILESLIPCLEEHFVSHWVFACHVLKSRKRL